MTAKLLSEIYDLSKSDTPWDDDVFYKKLAALGNEGMPDLFSVDNMGVHKANSKAKLNLAFFALTTLSKESRDQINLNHLLASLTDQELEQLALRTFQYEQGKYHKELLSHLLADPELRARHLKRCIEGPSPRPGLLEAALNDASTQDAVAANNNALLLSAIKQKRRLVAQIILQKSAKARESAHTNDNALLKAAIENEMKDVATALLENTKVHQSAATLQQLARDKNMPDLAKLMTPQPVAFSQTGQSPSRKSAQPVQRAESATQTPSSQSGLQDPIDNYNAYLRAAAHFHTNFLSKRYEGANEGFIRNQRFLVQASYYNAGKKRRLTLSSNHKVFNDYFDSFKDGKPTKSIEEVLEEKGLTVEKIAHRPNHGLPHSVTQAATIPRIVAFKQTHIAKRNNKNATYNNMGPSEIARLQAMALASVVGREDEIGFFGDQDIYKTYRVSSAKAFFDYYFNCPKDTNIYDLPKDYTKLVHDAVIVEIMGNPSISEQVLQSPLGIIQYIKEKYPQIPEDIIKDVIDNSFQDPYQANQIRRGHNPFLEVLNLSHSLELLRCYGNNSPKDADGNRQSTTRTLIPALLADCEDAGLEDAVSLLLYSRNLIKKRGDRLTSNIDSQYLESLGSGDDFYQHPDVVAYLAASTAEKVNTQFIMKLLGGEPQKYHPNFFEYCNFIDRAASENSRVPAEDVMKIAHDMLNTPPPPLSFEQTVPRAGSQSSYEVIKVIPPNRLGTFIAGQFSGETQDLRIEPKKRFTLMPDGVKPSIQKESTVKDKTDLSQHQSVSLVSENVRPRVFGRDFTCVGVRYPFNQIEVNRMLLGLGTALRPYDYNDKQTAIEAYQSRVANQTFFRDIQSFEQALIEAGPTEINEILAYLKWNSDNCSVCIYRPNHCSRLLAQEYARRIKRQTGHDVTITSYERYDDTNTVYTKAEQEADVKEANVLFEDETLNIYLDQIVRKKNYELLLTEHNATKMLSHENHVNMLIYILCQDPDTASFVFEGMLALAGKNIQDISFSNMEDDFAKFLPVTLKNLHGMERNAFQDELYSKLINAYLEKKLKGVEGLELPNEILIDVILQGLPDEACQKALTDHKLVNKENQRQMAVTSLKYGKKETFKHLIKGMDPITSAEITPVFQEIKLDDLINIIQDKEIKLPDGFLEAALLRRDRDKLRLVKAIHKTGQLKSFGLDVILDLFLTSETVRGKALSGDLIGFSSLEQEDQLTQIGKREAEIVLYLIQNNLVADKDLNALQAVAHLAQNSTLENAIKQKQAQLAPPEGREQSYIPSQPPGQGLSSQQALREKLEATLGQGRPGQKPGRG